MRKLVISCLLCLTGCVEDPEPLLREPPKAVVADEVSPPAFVTLACAEMSREQIDAALAIMEADRESGLNRINAYYSALLADPECECSECLDALALYVFTR